ncbi:hypothetical protein JYT72_01030 [Crocinitomix catalasitica]|nr:hypothetical protein [Crocinitomix catalasitica]
MKAILLASAFLFASSYLSAQPNFEWAKSIGSTVILSFDMGWAITSDGSGNVISVGQFYETVDFDPGAGVGTENSEVILANRTC